MYSNYCPLHLLLSLPIPIILHLPTSPFPTCHFETQIF